MDFNSDFAALDILEAANREKKWCRENYTTEHSPLAGEIGDSFFRDVRYLPCLRYTDILTWKSDNLKVPEYTLSNSDFVPRYLHDKRFEGIRILERLPVELRLQVYHELVHTWESFKAFPETIHRNKEVSLGMARRNRLPAYGPDIDTHVQTCSAPNCLNDTTFDQKFGMLDYFKDAEWDNIKASVKTMQDFKSICGSRGKGRDGAVDVLEDFLSYFWDETVLDVCFYASHMQRSSHFYILQHSTALYRFPLQEQILHSRIRHITLEASPREVASDWFLRTVLNRQNSPYQQTEHHQQAFYPYRGPNRFIQRCKFVTAHLPNLRTASVFITMNPESMKQIRVYTETHPKDPRAFMKAFKAMTPWKRTVMNIPAKERLDVAVLVSPGSRIYTTDCLTGTCGRMAEMTRLMYMALPRYLSPMHVDRFDGDRYFGLDALFMET